MAGLEAALRKPVERLVRDHGTGLLHMANTQGNEAINGLAVALHQQKDKRKQTEAARLFRRVLAVQEVTLEQGDLLIHDPMCGLVFSSSSRGCALAANG